MFNGNSINELLNIDSLAGDVFGGILVLTIILFVIIMAVYIVTVIAKWFLFKKAGKAGWEAIIPVYSDFVLVEIAGLNWWYFLLIIGGSLFSTFASKNYSWISSLASTVLYFFVFYNLAKKMNKSPVSNGILGAIFPNIIIMIYGFSKNYEYDKSVSVSPNGPFGDNANNSNYSSMERFCLGCGKKLKPNSLFCENCGKKVEQ